MLFFILVVCGLCLWKGIVWNSWDCESVEKEKNIDRFGFSLVEIDLSEVFCEKCLWFVFVLFGIRCYLIYWYVVNNVRVFL